jgi:hypothetical protein
LGTVNRRVELLALEAIKLQLAAFNLLLAKSLALLVPLHGHAPPATRRKGDEAEHEDDRDDSESNPRFAHGPHPFQR